MRRHRLQRAAWWLLVLVVLTACAATAVLTPSAGEVLGDGGVLLLPFIGYVGVGALVSWRRPDNPIGWVFLSAGALLSVAALAKVGVDVVLSAGPPVPAWGVAATWYDHVFWLPAFMLATGFTFLLYPDGLPSRRWRPVLWAMIAATIVGTATLAVTPLLDVDQGGVRAGALVVANPLRPAFISASLDLRHTAWWYVPFAACLVCIVVSIIAAALRFWRSRGIERQQMRLFAIAVILLPLVMWNSVTFALVLTALPVACGLAILRYHLYDIDRLLSRTTAYTLVTGVLLVVYVSVVTTIGQVLPDSGGLAVTAATLAAAAAFRPVLAWSRRLVDRHFNREQFDAERAAVEFAVSLREEVDAQTVADRLVSVVDRTVQPSSVGVVVLSRDGAGELR